jgi:hypothetical protein
MGRTSRLPRRCRRCQVCRSCTALRTCSAARRRTSVHGWRRRHVAAELVGRRCNDVGRVQLAALVGNHRGSRHAGAAHVHLFAVGCGISLSRRALRIAGAAFTTRRASSFGPGCLGWKGCCGVHRSGVHRLRINGSSCSCSPDCRGACVVGGAIKEPDGGGNGECAASGAQGQAHRHHCLNGRRASEKRPLC